MIDERKMEKREVEETGGDEKSERKGGKERKDVKGEIRERKG